MFALLVIVRSAANGLNLLIPDTMVCYCSLSCFSGDNHTNEWKCGSKVNEDKTYCIETHILAQQTMRSILFTQASVDKWKCFFHAEQTNTHPLS